MRRSPDPEQLNSAQHPSADRKRPQASDKAIRISDNPSIRRRSPALPNLDTRVCFKVIPPHRAIPPHSSRTLKATCIASQPPTSQSQASTDRFEPRTSASVRAKVDMAPTYKSVVTFSGWEQIQICPAVISGMPSIRSSGHSAATGIGQKHTAATPMPPGA